MIIKYQDRNEVSIMEKKYSIFLVLILAAFFSAECVLANQDDPALKMSSQDKNLIKRFKACIPGTIWFKDLSSGSRPDKVIPAWFEFFRKPTYSGLFTKLWRARKTDRNWHNLAEEIRNKTKEVKKKARLASEVIRLIDFGDRTYQDCRGLGEPIMDLVDKQRDIAMAWVQGMKFATRHELKMRDARKKQQEVEIAYDELETKRKNIESMR